MPHPCERTRLNGGYLGIYLGCLDRSSRRLQDSSSCQVQSPDAIILVIPVRLLASSRNSSSDHLNRMTTFAFIATAMLFQGAYSSRFEMVFSLELIRLSPVAPIGNCQNLQTAMGWCFAAAVPLTSALFLFRIAAVFSGNKPVVIFFVLTWLATVGCSILTPFAIGGDHIAWTTRCINTTLKPIVLAGTVANACNDTLVFLALSWRLSFNSTAPGFAGRSRSVVRGTGLPKLSRTLLQSGQLYYLQVPPFNSHLNPADHHLHVIGQPWDSTSSP